MPDVHYVIDTKYANAHLFDITLNIKKPHAKGQILSLPVWTIGSYLVRDFSKHIVALSAQNATNGKALNVKQLDKNHWQIAPCKQAISVHYQVYSFDSSVRSAYLTNERAFFNGNALCLCVQDKEATPHHLHIKTQHKTWQIYTTLKKIDKNHYQADDYAELIDSPIEMGNAKHFSFSVHDIKHQMVISGTENVDDKMLKRDLTKLLKHHHLLFQNAPFQDYLFLVLATKNSYGGLEHRNSTALICTRQDLPHKNQVLSRKNYERFLGLCSHEYFHAWWIKTIKPHVLLQPNLNSEVYTEQLWIFEGFTAYYDDLSLLRTAILDLDGYLALIASNITRFYQTPGRLKQTLANSSFEAWTKFYQSNENSINANISYYLKGALVAFLLDVRLRRSSQDALSLDEVVRYAWQHFQKSGLQDDSIQQIIKTLSGSDNADFFADYLYSTKELPLQEAFAYFGIDYQLQDATDTIVFGAMFSNDNQLPKITHVLNNSPAERAGLCVNDLMIAINDMQVSADNINERLNEYPINSKIFVDFFRDGKLKRFDVKLTPFQHKICVLKAHENSDDDTLKRRKLWQSPPWLK